MNNSLDEQELKNIINIYKLKGNNSDLWKILKLDINKEEYDEKIILFVINELLEGNNNELTLDIIDYIIDEGSCSIKNKIFQNNFFNLFLEKTIENRDNNIIKEKSLFLLKKWKDKFNDKNKELINKYNKYKSEGMYFPENIKTYDKYIQIEENKEYNKELDNFDNMKTQIKNIENEKKEDNGKTKGNIYEDNTMDFKEIDNPFDEYYENLLENVEIPDDEKYQNKFSNLRTSDIPMYFKTLRSKSIVENTSNLKNNNKNKNNDLKNQEDNNKNEINQENDNNEENKIIDGETNNINSETSMNTIINKENNYTSTFKNFLANPEGFENKWKDKITSINKWIKEGKNSKNFDNLQEGVKQLLIELDEIEEIISCYTKIGDDESRNKISYMKSDMEQTCYRYECLIQGKKVEKFKSAFNGNTKKYYFYRPGLLEEKNININVIEGPKKEKKISKFGKAIKNGFLKVGKKIKSKSKSKEKKSENIRELESIGFIDKEDEK